MYLSDEEKNIILPRLAEEHFQALLDARLKRVVKEKLKIFSKGSKSRNFFQDLTEDNFKFLRQIITCRVGAMNSLLKKLNRYPKPKGKFGIHVRDVFKYSYFSNSESKYNAYILAKKLDVNTCLYCNRNYTLTIKNGTKKVVRTHFDHFLPQSKYPYLAISFYNLIPCCNICNSTLKGAKDMDLNKHLHPYKTAFDDTVQFSLTFKKGHSAKRFHSYRNYLDIFYDKDDTFDLVFINRKSAKTSAIKRAYANIDLFQLTELYNGHKDIVIEMLQNAIIYNDSRIDELYDKYKGTLFRNRNDIIRFITSNYPSGTLMKKRAFSKLTRDIHEEFGLRF